MMDIKDIILAVMALVITFTFAFWSGGQYELYKIHKTLTGMIDGFDEFLDDVDDIMDGDESSYDDTFSQIKF